MSELRSFLVGVVIAGALLLVVGVAFGLFGGDDSGAPSVRLLGTPPATRTPPPAVTRSPSEFTPVATVSVPGTPSDGTPAEGATPAPEVTTGPGETPAVVETPIPVATAEPTLEVAPTAVPATQAPQTNDGQEYAASVNQYAPNLISELTFLAGNAGAPSIASPEWRSRTLESANTVQGLAAALSGVSAPGCVAGPHSALLAAAGQAGSSAAVVINAVNTNSAGDARAQAPVLLSARDGIDGATASLGSVIGEC